VKKTMSKLLAAVILSSGSSASKVEVFQAVNLSSVHFYANVYLGKVFCPECGCDGTLSLKSSGSFQVQHYVCRFKTEDGKRGTKLRYCTLWSLGKLQFHIHRCFGIAIPLWVRRNPLYVVSK
jgi:hypothetical protein